METFDDKTSDEDLYDLDRAYNLFSYEPSEPKSPAPLPIDLRPRCQFLESRMRHAINLPLEEIGVGFYSFDIFRKSTY